MRNTRKSAVLINKPKSGNILTVFVTLLYRLYGLYLLNAVLISYILFVFPYEHLRQDSQQKLI